MSNTALGNLTNASTPVNIQSYGFFADASSGVRITGHDFQSLFGRLSTRVAVTSTTFWILNNNERQLTFDTLVSSTDPLGAFNAASAGILKAPYAGYYQVFVNYRENEDDVDTNYFWIYVESAGRPGCEHRVLSRYTSAGSGSGKSFTTAVFTAGANEQIQVFARSSETNEHDLNSSSSSLLTVDLTLVERTA